jgi:hypothetical protein
MRRRLRNSINGNNTKLDGFPETIAYVEGTHTPEQVGKMFLQKLNDTLHGT